MTTTAATTANITLPQVPCQHVADIELPREVQGLYELAYNLWWTWNPKATELFSAVDSRAWAHYHNPVQMLINVERRQWEHLVENDTFIEAYSSLIDEFQGYMAGAARAWFWRNYPQYESGPVAYLSMEYGVHQSLAIYSGGLGILSGDHLKSASDLAVPLVAVGLLYRSGYFQQTVDPDGHQQHTYPEYDFSRLPVRPVAGPTGRDVVVRVPIADRDVCVKVWVAQVGRVPLLLLDTDIGDNDAADRPITTMLYVQGRAMRLAQEIVLGIGGVRALQACGIEPAAWHINEGHSALLQLERVAGELAKGEGVALEEAHQRVRATTVFTTHTPVPAGNESFDGDLAWRYLGPWGERLGATWDAVRALAQAGQAEGALNLTALALRTARYANGVSAIHAAVSRRMWQPLFGAAEADAVPIDHVTNGVHLPTWLGREMQDLLRRHLGHEWQGQIHYADAVGKLAEVPGEELWQAHQAQKKRLGRFTQSRLRDQLARHGRSPEELREVESFFRPEALTIGFARRFATYKRASLVFTDPHELRRLISDESRPVQILFAGKAHPADRPGQEVIQHIFQLSQQPPFRGRVFFLENYDIRVATMLVQGVDVWLNTPRRPLEASGTSGQKAGMNGALNCSVLDGWWPEAYDAENPNGWAIGRQEVLADVGAQDLEDAHALYAVLAEEVVPTFFERDERGLPLRWLRMMARSIATIAPTFSSDRMVRDYVTKAYLAGVERSSGG
jgi:starch phosphorylase